MANEPPFELTAGFSDGVTRIDVTGDLDVTTSSTLAEMFSIAMDRQPSRLVLDLGGVQYLSCAATRVIAEAVQAMRGRQFVIRNPLPIVRRMLQLTGIDAVLDEGQGGRPRRSPAAGPEAVAVTAASAGRICVLTVTGDLDLTVADGFTARATQAVAAVHGQAERLVLDLAGLAFLDCAGARALEQVARAVPAGCPVIVRAVSPVAARVLKLIGLNLEHPPAPGAVALHPPEANVYHDKQVIQQAQLTRARMADLVTSLRMTAEQLASTGDKVAATFARMAEVCPQDAARLSALSAAAHEFAARSRRHAVGPAQ